MLVLVGAVSEVGASLEGNRGRRAESYCRGAGSIGRTQTRAVFYLRESEQRTR